MRKMAWNLDTLVAVRAIMFVAVTYQRGVHGGHGPSLTALRGPLRSRNSFSKQWIKRLLGRKIYIKDSFMYPWLPEGPLMTQCRPLQSSEGPWFPGP